MAPYNDLPFPTGAQGVMAQSVDPNPKCEGCLHYSSNQGQTGVCQIGLRPFNCGGGESPSIGYAPMASLAPEHQNQTFSAQASGGEGREGGDIAMQVAVLGEEHVAMVKSLAAQLQHLGLCRLHQHGARSGESSRSTAVIQKCECTPVSESRIVKALAGSLSNRARYVLGSNVNEYLTLFVHDVLHTSDDLYAIHKSMTQELIEKSGAKLRVERGLHSLSAEAPHGTYVAHEGRHGGVDAHYHPLKGASVRIATGVHMRDAERAIHQHHAKQMKAKLGKSMTQELVKSAPGYVASGKTLSGKAIHVPPTMHAAHAGHPDETPGFHAQHASAAQAHVASLTHYTAKDHQDAAFHHLGQARRSLADVRATDKVPSWTHRALAHAHMDAAKQKGLFTRSQSEQQDDLVKSESAGPTYGKAKLSVKGASHDMPQHLHDALHYVADNHGMSNPKISIAPHPKKEGVHVIRVKGQLGTANASQKYEVSKK